MSTQPTNPTRTPRRLAGLVVVGLTLGGLAGFLPLVLGTMGLTPAALIVALAVMVRPRFVLLAAVAAGVGAAWGSGTISTLARCGAQADFCGDANLWPLGLASVAAFTVAAASARATVRRRRPAG